MGLAPLCASQGFHHFSGCECELIKNVCFSTFLVAGNLTLTFSDEYIFFNSGKKPLKRFESFYEYTRNVFTGKNYIQVYKKKN